MQVLRDNHAHSTGWGFIRRVGGRGVDATCPRCGQVKRLDYYTFRENPKKMCDECASSFSLETEYPDWELVKVVSKETPGRCLTYLARCKHCGRETKRGLKFLNKHLCTCRKKSNENKKNQERTEIAG